MQAVVIAGPKKSGKTALLALVAEALERRGNRVAVVKYSSHPLEKGNTDAFWLMRPNRAVVSASPGETAVFWPEQLSFEAVASLLRADVLLLEGGDVPDFVPRIMCCREDDEAEACAPEQGDFAVIATHGSRGAPEGVPHFPELDLQAAEKLASLILEKGAKV